MIQWSRFHAIAVLAFFCAAMLWMMPRYAFKLKNTRPTAEEYHLEFIKVPSAQRARDWLKIYTSKPHIAGSVENFELAEWTRDTIRSFGITNVTLQTYYPLLNYPVGQRVAITNPPAQRVELELREDAIDEDEASVKYRDVIPPFHGYSANGNVTGRLIYVNYGRLEDFKQLSDRGVSFKDAIALTRYGKNFRGLKIRACEVYGCAGVLVYSDPQDDGYSVGKTYPDGPWRPESSIQRGSVHYNSLYPGDPLTPGFAAHENVTRIPQEEAVVLPKIPSLPISYRDASKLLRALAGQGFNMGAQDKGWKGALPLEYWTGPGNVEVNLYNGVEFKITPVYNVIATITGAEEPDRAVILGNHRDAWVMGAVDPNSGSAAMLEVARGLGELLRSGWKPRRTIILASWDAEEYGMVGSTEFAEDFAAELGKSLVAYLNVDTAVSGEDLQVSATPTLSQLIRDIAKLVQDPSTNRTVYERWLNATKDVGAPSLPYVGQLGSGSDFVAFLDFIGVSSINLAFRGRYGVYHSNYDSFHWMEKFGDPTFEYHTVAARIWGIMALKLVDAEILPFNYSEYAQELQYYKKTLELKMSHRAGLKVLGKAIENLDDVARQVSLEINQLTRQVDRMERSCRFPLTTLLCFEARDSLKQRQRKLNDRLFLAERQFLDPDGIPGRTWFKHVVYAPGLWAGYGAATFPSLTEAISKAQESGSWSYVFKEEVKIASHVKRVADFLKG